MTAPAPLDGEGDGPVAETPALHVLVAEDDDEMRALLEMALRGQGYQVTAVTSGRDLMIAFDKTLCSTEQTEVVVVTDVRMPGTAAPVSGLDVLAEIRKRGSTAAVFLISGFADVGLKRSAARWGVTAVLDKPFDLELLCQHLLAVANPTDSD